MPFITEILNSAPSQKSVVSMNRHEDNRVTRNTPLIVPELLKMIAPLQPDAIDTVRKGRREADQVLNGTSDKLLFIVGPCSVHDPASAVEYGHRLRELSDELSDDLVVIMRAYLEKPRTTVGWKGLINGPELNETYHINKGLTIARKLFSDLVDLGMPIATEILDTISPQYLADCVSLGAIGARTTESQVHREVASGLSFPVGFKNATDGNIGAAANAMMSASKPHHSIGISEQGQASIVETMGNKNGFVILRGGTSGTNYDSKSVQEAKTALKKHNQPSRIMIDCSHGNSNKDHNNQPKVAANISSQLKSGERGIVGVMIESNLTDGRQDIPQEGPAALKKGISITDACIGWNSTEATLRDLATAVRARRMGYAD